MLWQAAGWDTNATGCASRGRDTLVACARDRHPATGEEPFPPEALPRTTRCLEAARSRGSNASDGARAQGGLVHARGRPPAARADRVRSVCAKDDVAVAI